MLILTIWDTLIGILAFVFVLGTIILVHEGGHFYFASKAGILCREYAFGMGPLLFSKKKGETLYAIRALPIGGFCAIAGEESEEDPLKDKEEVRLLIEDGLVKKICFEVDCPLFKDMPLYKLKEYDLLDKEQTGKLYITVYDGDIEKTFDVDPKASYVYLGKVKYNPNLKEEELKKKCVNEFQIAPYNRQMNSKTLWQRTLVVFGGPLTNIILAFLVFVISFMMTGTSNINSTQLSEVYEGTAAYEAGLRDGDVLFKLESEGSNGLISNELKKWDDISVFMNKYKADSKAEKITISYYEDGDKNKVKEVELTPIVFIYSISMYQDINSDEVKIAPLAEASKAYKGGLREGDIILSVNGNNVSTWKDVYNEFAKIEEGNQEVVVKVSRMNKETNTSEEVNCTVVPYSKELFAKTQSVDYVDVQIGISPILTRNIFTVIGAAFKEMGTSFVQLIRTLGMLFTSKEIGLKDMSGVIGIFSMTSDAAKGGFANLLYWMGFLSINVGIMNLLPIPALDGGRLVFFAIEGIFKKPVPQKIQDRAINITMILLLALMLYVAVFDVLRLF